MGCLRIFLPVAAILSFSSAAFAELRSGSGAGNGGGIAEQNFTYAYLNLRKYIELCLSSPRCEVASDERKLLSEIKDSLPREKKLRFAPLSIEPPRIAATGSDVGDEITVNTNLLYKDSIYDVPTCVASLVHELGHHHGVSDHGALDLLGAKVRSIAQEHSDGRRKNFLGVKISATLGLVYLAGGGVGSADGIDYGARTDLGYHTSLDATYDFIGELGAGLFLDQNLLSGYADGTKGNVWFAGGMARYGLVKDYGLFADLKLGFSRTSTSRYVTDTAFGYGLGLGYRFMISRSWSLSPKIDYRDLGKGTVPGTGLSLGPIFVDFAVMATYEF